MACDPWKREDALRLRKVGDEGKKQRSESGNRWDVGGSDRGRWKGENDGGWIEKRKAGNGV
jgi:hypothetical protein